MAAVAEITAEAAAAATTNINNNIIKPTKNLDSDLNSNSKPKSESEFSVQKLVDMFTKLNPLAKEFFPSSYNPQNHLLHLNNPFAAAVPPEKQSPDDDSPNNRRRKNNFNQGRRRLNGRLYRAQREDSIRRTVYVSDIDQHVTEERLAGLFSGCGQVSSIEYHLKFVTVFTIGIFGGCLILMMFIFCLVMLFHGCLAP
ncbi:hypothetical protein Tsubulata_024274 [Turnera subulata]|uniref:Ataxin-2 C-terminal domain-containing protein n=1 Tax=Turnera subulata TaxID=218843 RepID=A0A9Q0JHS9_9ROSI|nr:hypothetical protein Tsubulata_024274 [Turnera subulata]